MILMKCIIQELSDINESTVITKKTFSRYINDGECYKLELENEDNSFLHNCIFSDGSNIEPESPSQKKLINAKNQIINFLKNQTIKNQEKIYYTLTSADIIIYVVDKISDATQIFELLNDRGKKLTSLEGVKSFLMYRIGSLNLKDAGEQTINSIQDSFSTIYRLIEKYDLNESDILRYHTIAFEESKTDDYNIPDKFIKRKINKMFEQDVDDKTIKKEITNYVDRLKDSFQTFKYLKNNEMNSNHLNNLFMIGRVNPFYPLLMHIHHNYGDKLESFIIDLTKFTFRATLIGLRNDNEGFYSYIRNEEDYTELFKWPINDNWWNINKRTESILNYENFYEWVNSNMVKYILFSYENSLRNGKGYPLLTIADYFTSAKREKISIEHISAQKNKNLKYDEDFEENYLHSLGNLVLDTASSNSRKSNNGINIKMDEFVKSSIMSQTELNDSKTDWGNLENVKLFIKKRNSTLLGFIRTNLM